MDAYSAYAHTKTAAAAKRSEKDGETLLARLFLFVVVGAEVGDVVPVVAVDPVVETGTCSVVVVAVMPVTVAPEEEITLCTAVEFAALVTACCNTASCAVMFGAPDPPVVLPPITDSIADVLGKKTVITTWKATALFFPSITMVALTVLGSTPREEATLLAREVVSTAAGSPVIANWRVTVAVVVV